MDIELVKRPTRSNTTIPTIVVVPASPPKVTKWTAEVDMAKRRAAGLRMRI